VLVSRRRTDRFQFNDARTTDQHIDRREDNDVGYEAGL
jgi:hypothetical protein